MGNVITLAFPFFGLIFMGFFAARWFKDQGSLGWLNTFVLYFALPALFFQLISRTPFDQLANWRFVLTTTFATYCAFAVSFALGAVLTRGNLSEATIQGGLGSYSNIGYMGPGLTLAAYGTGASVPTALILCFDNMLMFTIIPLMMAMSGASHKNIAHTAAEVARRIVTHPFIVATILGVIAAYFEIPTPMALDKLLTMLASAAAPCALFAMGINIAQRPIRRIPNEIPFLVTGKLIIHPAITLSLLTIVGGFEPVWVYTALLMAALPPAANMFVLAQQYDIYIERASSTILIGTIVSVASVTGLLYLVSHNLIPLGP